MSSNPKTPDYRRHFTRKIEHELTVLICMVEAAHNHPIEHCNATDIALTDLASKAAQVLTFNTELRAIILDDASVTNEEFKASMARVAERRIISKADDLAELVLASHDFPVNVGLTATDIELTEQAQTLKKAIDALEVFDEIVSELVNYDNALKGGE